MRTKSNWILTGKHLELLDIIQDIGFTVAESFAGIVMGNTLGGLIPGELGSFVGDSLGNIANTMFFDTAKEIISRPNSRKSKLTTLLCLINLSVKTVHFHL